MPDPLLTELEKRGTAADRELAVKRDYEWLDLVVVFSKRRHLLSYFTAGALVLSTIVAFLLPVKYTATVKIMPPNQAGSTSSLLSALAGSSGAGGGAASSLLTGALGLKNPSDVYVAMLKSRTLRDSIIDRFKLKDLYGKKTYADTRKKLEWNTDVATGKEGVITLDFEDSDPKRAAAIAEGYIDELFKVSESIAAGEAGERRKFYERQLEKQKNKLADAEIELKKVQQQTGLIVPSDQAKAIIESVARLRGMVAAKEVQLSAMLAFATEQNPEYVQTERELTELRAQLTKLEKSQGGGPSSEGDLFVPTGKVPESALQFIRTYRDFRYQETLYELLAKQYEIARLDEARDYAPVQVLDHAAVPDKRSKPYRLLIIALSTLAGFVVGCWMSLVQEGREQHAGSAYRRQKWELIKSYWHRGDRK